MLKYFYWCILYTSYTLDHITFRLRVFAYKDRSKLPISTKHSKQSCRFGSLSAGCIHASRRQALKLTVY